MARAAVQPQYTDCMWKAVALAIVAGSLLHSAPVYTLLAVFAHPDDETVIGPLLAKYSREGHKVHLITLTAGQKGVSEHAKIPEGDALAAVRAKELACSAEKLGLTSHKLDHA